jgi:ABC-type antimicrobial peptide transport system permease subunit
MIPFKYNFRNLFVRWRTTLLTAAGFTLIVALLVVMLGFIQGVYDLASKSGPRGNVIVMSEGSTDELFSTLNFDDDLPRIWNRTPETIKDGDQPRWSREIYCVATQEVPPAREGDLPTYRFLQIRGLDDDPEIVGRVHGLRLKAGRWFNQDGTEIVLGEGIARLLKVGVGDKLQLRPSLIWTITGILESGGSPFDSEIWGKGQVVGQSFGKDDPEKKQRFYTSIVLSTPTALTAQTAADAMKKNTSLELSAMPETKYYEELSKGNALFLYAALFIAVVMSVGGMFGLMNTMFAAVSQRIKDIGVLRVLGFSKGQILVSFLLESLILALLGGLLGIGLGYLANGLEQTGVMNSGGGGGKTIVFKITVNYWVLAVAAGFTLFMGLLGGLLPSFSAMRMKVLDTLR